MISKQPTAEPTEDASGAAVSEGLFRCHAPAVFAVCLANTQNYHDAEDARAGGFHEGRRKDLNPAGTVAGSCLADASRASNVHRFPSQAKTDGTALEEPSARPPMTNIACERLHEAIQKLPQNYREAIVLYYLDGRNCSGVAASLGIAEPAVRQRLVRARAMLHDLLQEEQL